MKRAHVNIIQIDYSLLVAALWDGSNVGESRKLMFNRFLIIGIVVGVFFKQWKLKPHNKI